MLLHVWNRLAALSNCKCWLVFYKRVAVKMMPPSAEGVVGCVCLGGGGAGHQQLSAFP